MAAKVSKAEIERRRDFVMHLWGQRATEREITRQLAEQDYGTWSRSTVRNDIRIRCEELAESIENVPRLRIMTVRQFDQLIRQWWSKASSELNAARFVSDLIERRARFLGLGAPLKIKHSGDASAPIEVKTQPASRPDFSNLSLEEKIQLRDLIRRAKSQDQDNARPAATDPSPGSPGKLH